MKVTRRSNLLYFTLKQLTSRYTHATSSITPTTTLQAQALYDPVTDHVVLQWALVLTGVSDFARPAESLSLTQNAALMATGAIWTRWCFVIKPRNVL